MSKYIWLTFARIVSRDLKIFDFWGNSVSRTLKIDMFQKFSRETVFLKSTKPAEISKIQFLWNLIPLMYSELHFSYKSWKKQLFELITKNAN